jgi:hypothetical protein
VNKSDIISSSGPTASLAKARSSKRWGWARRSLLLLALLATLIAVFYTVENWRGKRAWEKHRRGLEARGVILDWKSQIPPPVLDEQNIFKAPKMQEWFVKNSLAESVRSDSGRDPFAVSTGGKVSTEPLLLAEVKLVTAKESFELDQTNTLVRMEDPAARQQVRKLIEQALGAWVEGPQSCVITRGSREQIKPIRLVLQTDAQIIGGVLARERSGETPITTEIAELFPRNPAGDSLWSSSTIDFRDVQQVSSNSFRVWLKGPVYAAADYLARSEPLTANFDLIRKALERPYARMDGDYTRPFETPIPNFVRVRTVVQLLAQRAQSNLLLGQPEAAWRDLALIRDLRRLLEAEPEGKPMTLVAAMINVAVTGIYAQVVQDGLRLGAWHEPQLVAIQQQLKEVELMRVVSRSFDCERVAACRTLETTAPSDLAKVFSIGSPNASFWERLQHPAGLLLGLAPRGWLFQNMVVCGNLDEMAIESLDATSGVIQPARAETAMQEISTALNGIFPYTFLARITTPNFVRAMQTVARNQSLVNEAMIACGLERYRLAKGQFPDALESLAPEFLEKVPHDIINGGTLKYRRTTDGGYVVYSIGWNEKDDGGTPGRNVQEGDWVWSCGARE